MGDPVGKLAALKVRLRNRKPPVKNGGHSEEYDPCR